MKVIRVSLENKFTVKQIDVFTKLNEYGQAIYDANQMREIYQAVLYNIPEETIDIFARIKNNTPVFNYTQMYEMRNFIRDADDKQIEQLKACVDDGLAYPQIKALIHENISAEKMRILRSFYKLECDWVLICAYNLDLYLMTITGKFLLLEIF